MKPSPTRLLLALGGAALAALTLWTAASTHLERACTVGDTPYLPLCAREPPGADQLRDRIRRNPGDALAWARLLRVESGPAQPAVLNAAATLAPNHVAVLPRRAARALEQGDHATGVELLVQLLRYRSTPEAARVLAQLLAAPEGMELLRPHLAHADDWLPTVLSAAHVLKMPPGVALPLVSEAVAQHKLKVGTVRSYMATLKQGGHWLDAYGLWLVRHGQQLVPLLYNGGFDHGFEPDGFDWEFRPVPRSRAGVLMELTAVARRGRVLEIEFTGRSFATPILRQYVFAAPGSYMLRGEYMGSRLRTEAGLAWTVVCSGGKKEAVARSLPLGETGGAWKTFELAFTVPPHCGPVASVQLEPVASYEAAVGMKGRMAFDAFTLTRAPGSPG